MPVLFEASSIVFPNDKRAGTMTLQLTDDALKIDGKHGIKKYPLDRVNGYKQPGLLNKTKVTIDLSSEDDLEIQFGGLRGKQNAQAFVQALRSAM